MARLRVGDDKKMRAEAAARLQEKESMNFQRSNEAEKRARLNEFGNPSKADLEKARKLREGKSKGSSRPAPKPKAKGSSRVDSRLKQMKDARKKRK